MVTTSQSRRSGRYVIDIVQAWHGVAITKPSSTKFISRMETDLSHVSQTLMSDEARRSPKKKELRNITRDHDSVNCNSSRQWVAVVIDLGMEQSAVELNFTFRHFISPISQIAPGCPRLHIGVAEIRGNPFPYFN